jgi:D-xylose 1-dehydrogenase (NADP+, D-xylono-1,5-lactone-forming)
VAVAWGFLSTARINDAILEGARDTDRAEVVAVASRDRARAEAYARERGIERAHGSYEALLEDDGVEAVYVSLPNSLHVEWSIRALEAGKHVLCEKSFDWRPERVEEAFDAAERAGLVLMEAFMYRHHPQTKRFAKLVRDGAVGELRLLRASFAGRLWDEEDIRLRPELGGGALLDVGCYCVSGMRLVAGEPEPVSAQRVLAPSGVDLRFTGLLRFPGEVLGLFDCGFEVPYRAELTAVGTEGVLVAPDPWVIRTTGLELRRGEEVERIEVEQANRYRLQLENMADAIRGRARPLLDRADAVGQAGALAALLRAARASETVGLG